MLRGRWAVGLVVLAVLLTGAPYVVATMLAKPGTQFSGFLLNPVDGFSYLAKMREGAQAPLEFRLPYASQPGTGALLFVFYLVLGRLASLTHAQPILLYHLARIAGTLAMFAAAWTLFQRCLPSTTGRNLAFVLAAFGSGVGWLGIPFGLMGNDLSVPESIPLMSAYANAHFALASGLLVWSISLIAFPEYLSRFKLPLCYAAGLALALIQPFAALPVLLTGAIWLAWEGTQSGGLRATAGRWPPLVAFGAGCGPFLLYELVATRMQPALASWASQNLTPTAGILEVVLGYGLVLALAVAGLVWGGSLTRPGTRLLIIWSAVGLLLLFAPIALQRRMALGLYFPIAGLAGAALVELANGRRRMVLLIALLALSLPSHALVIGAGLASVAQGDPALLLDQSEQQTYRWIASNAPPDSLVLAAAQTGNRLPAYADIRVLYGHPFETPDAERQLALVTSLFEWSGAAQTGRDQLVRADIDFVVYGPEERKLGTPSWLGQLELEQQFDGTEIYRVSPP